MDCGELHIISGPMFSGKTSSLLNKLYRDNAIGLKVIYINHFIDDRNNKSFSTHNPIFNNNIEEKGIKFVKGDDLKNLLDLINNFDVVGIDEAQFFLDLLKVVPFIVEKLGKKVYVAGLDGTYERLPFGDIYKLIPLSDSFTKLHSYCKRCSEKEPKIISKALFTHRINDSKYEIDVGGIDKYIPVCRKCYIELNK